MEALEDARLEALAGSVITIQKHLRGMKARRDYHFYMHSKKAVVRMQAWARQIRGRRRFVVKKRVTVQLQAQHRGKQARKRVAGIREEKVKERAKLEKELAKQKELTKKAAAAAAAKAVGGGWWVVVVLGGVVMVGCVVVAVGAAAGAFAFVQHALSSHHDCNCCNHIIIPSLPHSRSHVLRAR